MIAWILSLLLLFATLPGTVELLFLSLGAALSKDRLMDRKKKIDQEKPPL